MFPPTTENFVNKILHSFRHITKNYKIYSTVSNFDNVMPQAPIKRDHLVNFCISLENAKKCNISATVRLINLHTV